MIQHALRATNEVTHSVGVWVGIVETSLTQRPAWAKPVRRAEVS